MRIACTLLKGQKASENGTLIKKSFKSVIHLSTGQTKV